MRWVCGFNHGAHDQTAKTGNLSLRLGLGWSKSNSLHTGQTPVLRYNRELMSRSLKIVNAKAINPGRCPEGLRRIRQGRAAAKFMLDPHGLLAKAV